MTPMNLIPRPKKKPQLYESLQALVNLYNINPSISSIYPPHLPTANSFSPIPPTSQRNRMSRILTPFIASRLLVGLLIVTLLEVSTKLLLLPPSSGPLVTIMRCCGGREFVLGALLYATVNVKKDGEPRFQRQALLAGAAVDALDALILVASWALGEMGGAPAVVTVGGACMNLLMGRACWRGLVGRNVGGKRLQYG